jgi:hypothetical protein
VHGTTERARSGDALDGEAEAHGFEDGGEAAELGIALARERAIELSGIEIGFFGDSLHAAEGFGELAQGDEQVCLVAVFKDAVEQFDSVGGVVAKKFRP